MGKFGKFIKKKVLGQMDENDLIKLEKKAAFKEREAKARMKLSKAQGKISKSKGTSFLSNAAVNLSKTNIIGEKPKKKRKKTDREYSLLRSY